MMKSGWRVKKRREIPDKPIVVTPAELLADYYKKRAALDHEIDKTLAEIQRILGIEIKVEN